MLSVVVLLATVVGVGCVVVVVVVALLLLLLLLEVLTLTLALALTSLAHCAGGARGGCANREAGGSVGRGLTLALSSGDSAGGHHGCGVRDAVLAIHTATVATILA